MANLGEATVRWEMSSGMACLAYKAVEEEVAIAAHRRTRRVTVLAQWQHRGRRRRGFGVQHGPRSTFKARMWWSWGSCAAVWWATRRVRVGTCGGERREGRGAGHGVDAKEMRHRRAWHERRLHAGTGVKQGEVAPGGRGERGSGAAHSVSRVT